MTNAGHEGAPVPVVAVRGEAELEVEPELAELSLAVQAKAPDRKEAMQLLVKRLNATRDLLNGFGEAVERSEGSLWVHPVWTSDRNGRAKKIAGYEGRVPITVTVSTFDLLDQMVLALTGLEEIELRGPEWRLRPANPAYLEVREKAVAAAVQRARQYAAALGSTLVDLLELSDLGLGGGGFSGRLQVGYASSMMSGGGDAQLDLQPQPQTVNASVEARFTITPPTLD